MESTDLLLVGAEVSVAFAGFAGIIATFQFREAKQVKRGDVVGLTMIVQMSLNCALLSALPLLLSTFKLEATTIWTICSLYGGTYTAYSMQSVHRNMRGATQRWTLVMHHFSVDAQHARLPAADQAGSGRARR